jgi:hypothetical protein
MANLSGLNIGHPPVYSNFVFPVSNSCIMPCLMAWVLARRYSNAASSASMSDNTLAMAICSATGGTDNST